VPLRANRFTEEQIAFALKQVEMGTPVLEVCSKMRADGVAAAPVQDRNVAPTDRWSCDPRPDRARRAVPRHRGATANTADTCAPHKESVRAPSAAT
jgi:hypothetical protein